MNEFYPERTIADVRQIDPWLRETAMKLKETDSDSRLTQLLSMAKVPSLFNNLFVALSFPTSGLDPDKLKRDLEANGVSEEVIAEFEAAILMREPDNLVELPNRDGEVTEEDPPLSPEAEKDIA